MINSKYWENEGAEKTFTHDLLHDWIKEIPLDANVLDLGCGYGRITKQLHNHGFINVVGYDPSKSMIQRAVVENQGPKYIYQIGDLLRQQYSLVICFALFTSCPEPELQSELKEIIQKQTSNSSWLYISDYLISENLHYSERYEQRKLGIYGCFGEKDTVIFRHHGDDHFSKLFSKWKQIKSRTVAGITLSGNMINITQLLYKKG